jgi:hypothetical protein
MRASIEGVYSVVGQFGVKENGKGIKKKLRNLYLQSWSGLQRFRRTRELDFFTARPGVM